MNPTCDFCGDNKSQALYSTQDFISCETFDVCQCPSCQLAFIAPRPKSENIHRYYSSYFNNKKGRFSLFVELPSYLTRYWRFIKVLRFSKKKSGVVLDVGCGRGMMLGFLKRDGWQVYGTELNEDTGKFARQRGIQLHYGDLIEARFEDEKFDVVTMWHVLEHVYSPSAALVEIYRILRPGGIAFIEVPNFSSVFADLQREDWFLLDVPRHLYQFRANVLVKQIEKTGFSVIRVSNAGYIYDLFSNIQYVFNKLGFSKNYLFDFLRGKSAERSSSAKVLNGILHLLFFPFVGLYAVGLSLVGWAIKSSGSVLIIARK